MGLMVDAALVPDPGHIVGKIEQELNVLARFSDQQLDEHQDKAVTKVASGGRSADP